MFIGATSTTLSKFSYYTAFVPNKKPGREISQPGFLFIECKLNHSNIEHLFYKQGLTEFNSLRLYVINTLNIRNDYKFYSSVFRS